jgi:Kef-type K+ transport system membrane component KefB
MTEFSSLLVIVAIAAATPLIVGILRIKVAEVVLLLAGGVVFGPQVLGWITVDDPIGLLSELGLGMLFFLAGMELEPHAVRGRSGRLAASGWGISLLLAAGISLALSFTGAVQDTLGVAIALTSTALGTLLPILRDAKELDTPFGTYFMGAGAWGEFGPILAISLLLGAQNRFIAIVTLAAFGAIALILAAIPKRFASDRVRQLLDAGHHTSSQTAVRITMLLLIVLLTVAGSFGLDVVLGAFVAGIIVRRIAPPSEESDLSVRIEAIAFGFFIPLFFVVSGANLDVESIAQNPGRLATFFILLVLVRGLPQFFLYRGAIPDNRQRARFALLVATALPIIVAITALEVETGIMLPQNAAALVGAGALTVLVFPLVGNALVKGRSAPIVDQDRAENTA